jgi:hypothetical protein
MSKKEVVTLIAGYTFASVFVGIIVTIFVLLQMLN